MRIEIEIEADDLNEVDSILDQMKADIQKGCKSGYYGDNCFYSVEGEETFDDDEDDDF